MCQDKNILIDLMIDRYEGKWVWGVEAEVYNTDLAIKRVSKVDFDARKAERQNKPDWTSILLKRPEAKYLAQDSSGYWVCFSKEVSVNPEGVGWGHDAFAFAICKGEVIGDWRDTLERRPAELNNIVQVNVKIEPEKSLPFSDLVDWYDYDSMKMKTNPPPGSECEIYHVGIGWIKTVIIGHDNGAVVRKEAAGKYIACYNCSFRPMNWDVIQKKKVIGNALAAGITLEKQSPRDIIERLYDAKMLVMPNKD